MKKYLLILVLSIFVSKLTYAQDFKFGLKGGLNLANVGGDIPNSVTFDTRVAYHAGIFAEIPLLFNFSIQPEVLYSAQGTETLTIEGIGNSNGTRLDYLNVPVLLKFNIILGLSVEAGPVFGVLVSAQNNTNNPDDPSDSDVSDRFETRDTGVAIGVSYSLHNGLIAGVRYNKGVKNFNNSDFSESENQNDVFQLWIGYSFL